jgi:hypothetical protein
LSRAITPIPRKRAAHSKGIRGPSREETPKEGYDTGLPGGLACRKNTLA